MTEAGAPWRTFRERHHIGVANGFSMIEMLPAMQMIAIGLVLIIVVAIMPRETGGETDAVIETFNTLPGCQSYGHVCMVIVSLLSAITNYERAVGLPLT